MAVRTIAPVTTRARRIEMVSVVAIGASPKVACYSHSSMKTPEMLSLPTPFDPRMYSSTSHSCSMLPFLQDKTRHCQIRCTASRAAETAAAQAQNNVALTYDRISICHARALGSSPATFRK